MYERLRAVLDGQSVGTTERSYRPDFVCQQLPSDVPDLIMCEDCGELYSCREHGKCDGSDCSKTRFECLSGKFTSSYGGKCWKCKARENPKFA